MVFFSEFGLFFNYERRDVAFEELQTYSRVSCDLRVSAQLYEQYLYRQGLIPYVVRMNRSYNIILPLYYTNSIITKRP